MTHLARERLTMSTMVGMYCRDHHESRDTLCEDCATFLDYAEVRLDKCPYGEDKPTCANCPVHCYKPQYRAKAKQIMPGMMKMKTGSSFSIAAQMEPRRASVSLGAPNVRWTMY